MGESDALGDAESICQEIRRVGGKDRVTYGELMKDEMVQSSFGGELKEAISVAQEHGLLTLEGSLDDDAALLVLASATDTAEAEEVSQEPAPQEAPAVEEVAEEPPAMPEAAATSELPAEETVAPEEAVAPEEVAPPAEEPAPVEETVAPAVEEAVASVVKNTAGDGEAGTGEVLSSTSSATVKKTEDGKWKVDTGYIDYRTKDPNNLEPRRGTILDAASTVVGQSSKDEDGKFKVDTSYINHRTGEVDRLEGRKSVMAGKMDGYAAAHSASVKKEEDGKWKVDTSYIGYRTGDTDNLTRKEDKTDGANFADPMEKKFSHEELKVSKGKPPEVDPASRERYLSDADFQSIFGMSLPEFQKLPKWKQQNAKKAKDLF